MGRSNRLGQAILAAAGAALLTGGSAWAEVDHTSRFNLGAGAGVPYGGVGVSAEITPKGATLGDFGCLGFAVGAGGAPSSYNGSASVRLYLIDRTRRAQLKFTLLGVASLAENSDDDVSGVDLGVGGVYHISKSLALDADSFLRLRQNSFVVAVGLRWHFY